MQITFTSSLNTGEIRTMNSKSDNVKIMLGNKTDDIIKELFESFKKRYQEGLETKMKGSPFVFESVNLLYYRLHQISLNRGGSYIDSPEGLKNKRATINPKNKNNECFKYAITVALNHGRYEKDPQRISKIKPFIDQYKLDMKKTLKEYQKLSLLLININWKGIEFPSHSKDWK